MKITSHTQNISLLCTHVHPSESSFLPWWKHMYLVILFSMVVKVDYVTQSNQWPGFMIHGNHWPQSLLRQKPSPISIQWILDKATRQLFICHYQLFFDETAILENACVFLGRLLSTGEWTNLAFLGIVALLWIATNVRRCAWYLCSAWYQIRSRYNQFQNQLLFTE